MTIKKYAVILLGKLLFRLLRLLLSGGTYLPGKTALRLCPDILSFAAQNVRTILVTGTNGKTTTVHMIAHMLQAEKTPCFASFSGGNEKSSICTEYILNYDLIRRKPKTALAVIECDEKYVPLVVPDVSPRVIIVTNIFKDQTDRLGSEEDVFRLFCDAMLPADAVFCLSEDEPYGQRLMDALSVKTIIRYSGSVGAARIDGQRVSLRIRLPGNYNYKNAAAACAALYALRQLTDRAVAALETVPIPFGRMEPITVDGVDVTLNLAKNVRGAEETLRFLASCGGAQKIVLGFNAQIEDGQDVSWIWEVPWKQYTAELRDVFVYGECAAFTEGVLHENGISASQIDDAGELLTQIQKSAAPVFLMMNYTCMMAFRKTLAAKGYVKDFWNR